ncbi:MAG: DUF4230 domain-containing protein [Bacteroidia bacterium]
MFKSINQSPWTKLGALIVVSALVAGLAFLGARMLRVSKKESLPRVLESVAYLNDLRLVKYYYEALIPVYKDYDKKGQPKGKLQFIAICPAEISGYVDMSEMQYNMLSDSLIGVTLPPARFTKPVIHLDSLKQYAIRNRGFALRLPGFRTNITGKAFNAIQVALTNTKKTVQDKALANGITSRTRRLAELYVRNTLNELGFQVQFVPPNEHTRLRETLLPELSGDGLLDQLPLQQRLDLLKKLEKINTNE